ncbi:metal-dependent hydrolase [Gluconobacter frateurii NBRC 103465]|nr:metal-dependent hydrolase [Gluconobacter frateurii NBRC 103465]
MPAGASSTPPISRPRKSPPSPAPRPWPVSVRSRKPIWETAFSHSKPMSLSQGTSASAATAMSCSAHGKSSVFWNMACVCKARNAAWPSPGPQGVDRRMAVPPEPRRGAQATGLPLSGLQPGARADLCVLDEQALSLPDLQNDDILDSAIFATSSPPVRHVMCAGQWRITDGYHPDEARLTRAFHATLRTLMAA